ncbi:MAG: zinc metalloprotease HtpX [Nanoarchaeota archaeon]
MLNQIKTVLLLGLLTGILLGIGYLIGGTGGLTIALIFAFIMNFISYWFSDKIVLFMYGAKEAKRSEYPKLHKIVEGVSKLANIPKPKVYIVPMNVPNAFATGRNKKHAVIACTTGILSLLNDEELKGVIAHEISHIKNRDILISSIAAVIAGAIAYIAMIARYSLFFGDNRDRGAAGLIVLVLLSIFVPIAAMIIQLAISRSREYLADESGARTIKNPIVLANALIKLDNSVRLHPLKNINPSITHILIVNPFSTKEVFISLFSTHPSVESRVKRLGDIKF